MASDYRQSEVPPEQQTKRQEVGQDRTQTAPSIDYSHRTHAAPPIPQKDSHSSRRTSPPINPTSYPVTRSDSLDSSIVPLRRPSLPPRSISLASAEFSLEQQQGIVPHRRPNDPSSIAPSQADAFMASLLRAAQTGDADTTQQQQQQQKGQHLAPLQPRLRPMSVSSMVDETEVDHHSRLKRQRLTESAKADDGQVALERKGERSVNVHPSHFTNRYQSLGGKPDSSSSFSSIATPAMLLPMSKVSPSSILQPLPRTSAAMPSYTATYSPAELERKLSGQLPTPTFEWNRASASSFSSSSGASSSSYSRGGPPSLPSRSIYTNDSSFPLRDSMEHKVSSSSSSSSSATSQYAAAASSSSLSAAKKSGSQNSTHEHNSRSSLVARALEEEQRWNAQTEKEKRLRIRDNILSARSDLVGSTSSSNTDGSSSNSNRTAPWPRKNSIMTSVLCMYANIAQKSYGSEKRFLCPPPVVKIDGPLRPCKWILARVVSGDCPTPSLTSLPLSQAGLGASASASGEEEAAMELIKEARFGKLHVGSLSDSKGKTFRLQINLLRSEEADDNIRATTRDDSHPSRAMAAGAWSTFHSFPISVISKPARKSARTRAASPAIVSGSIVCLYNRLNSQTVRTKYLSVEAGAQETGIKGDVRRLVARQDGWEGFAIDLLARPYKRTEMGSKVERGEIAYGCIVCLRDVNTNVCSEPMLICKVEKGRVDVSSIAGGSIDDGPMQYEVVGRDKMAAREVLAGGRRRREVVQETGQAIESSLLNVAKQESPEGSSESPGSTVLSIGGQGQSTDSAVGSSSNSNSIPGGGGAVIQMQKVTLMQVSPRLDNSDVFECDLSSPRSYLSSTAFEGARDRHTFAALARSREQLQSRLLAMQESEDDVDDDVDSGVQASPPSSRKSPGQASSFPVGFVRPPSDLSKGSDRVVDVLEDPFCWTIVTISQTEVSFIEANARIPTSSPHIPAGLLPITPIPSVAALPSYDHQSHAIAATIHDFYYNPNSQSRAVLNHVCATGTSATSNSSSMAHEIWLGHSGPLNYRSASAGPFMSDVTFQLPSLAHLQTLHAEFHSEDADDDGRLIRLPILFVRASQGITFISGHWLQATYYPQETFSRPIDTATRWRLAIV